jgi:hypothetical protein
MEVLVERCSAVMAPIVAQKVKGEEIPVKGKFAKLWH